MTKYYHYFVRFTVVERFVEKPNRIHSIGTCEIRRKKPITSYNQILDIQEGLLNDELYSSGVYHAVVDFYTLLRTEEE